MKMQLDGSTEPHNHRPAILLHDFIVICYIPRTRQVLLNQEGLINDRGGGMRKLK